MPWRARAIRPASCASSNGIFQLVWTDARSNPTAYQVFHRAVTVTTQAVAAPANLFSAGKVLGPLPGYQLLDSLAVEAGGKVCVATLVTGAVTAFDPDGAVPCRSSFGSTATPTRRGTPT